MDESLQAILWMRGFERLMIIALSGFLLWMSWKFFFHAFTAEQQEMELKGFGLSLKIQKFSPALIFACLGAGLLLYSINNEVELNHSVATIGGENTDINIAYLNQFYESIEFDTRMRVINSLISASGETQATSIDRMDFLTLQAGRSFYFALRQEQIAREFGEEAFVAWERYRSLVGSPESIPEEIREIVVRIEQAASYGQ